MPGNQFATTGIVLTRTTYQEADRIVTFLTPDGKVRAIAKGVRKPKSKLAGGVELFSVSDLTFITGKSELNTLISARLKRHFGNIVKDLERTNWAYEVLKILNRLTEETAGPEFLALLTDTLAALDDLKLALPLVKLWFDMQLLRSLGNEPNLTTDKTGAKLQPGHNYGFDIDTMAFYERENGDFTADHIKLLRLSLSNRPEVLGQVKGAQALLPATLKLVTNIRHNVLSI